MSTNDRIVCEAARAAELKESTFVNADLSGSGFRNADLTGARFAECS